MYKALLEAKKKRSANFTWSRVSKYDQVETKSVKIGWGVRYRCCLSPIPCNLCSKSLTKAVVEGFRDLKIAGQ